ncbi:MAG: exo-alpha-sialidase [Planctomycetota bacterium]|nr:MAG: exo-alpha-sialidase [Planctomycetota bacterium]
MIAAGKLRLTEGRPTLDLSRVPGVIIDHQPATSRLYIGSPSIAILEDGTYVASHDLFGPGEGAQCTLVFRSTDRGRTWERIARIPNQFWSTLFTHRGALYLIGPAGSYGPVVIRRSTDGGSTWTEPRDKKTGLLDDSARYHCAPVPVVEHAGRLWRGIEDAMAGGGWGAHFRALMMSVPVDADLLDADNWTFSERLARNPEWLDGTFGGWLEGNAVVTSEGEVVDILRVHRRPQGNTAAMIHIGPDGRTARFDPSHDFITFPGGAKKFTIRYDKVSGLYWSLVNTLPENYDGGEPDRVRNTLSLISSPDLRTWTIRTTILHHPETKYHAFQYVDWLFEGDDIIAVSRTAYDDGLGGAHNYHDANFMTFHRIEHFRDR